MRYHYEENLVSINMYGITYHCDHPVYDQCTLYLINGRGLAVIQQKFTSGKMTHWGPIDTKLTDALYLNKNFYKYFNKYADVRNKDGLFPTVTIRQIMWDLRMKPLKREPWETYFDRKPI